MTLWCRHGLAGESAPRTSIGGVTSDRAWSLTEDRFLDSQRTEMPVPCPRCGRVWIVSLVALESLATSRGPRLLNQLVDKVPGVSLGDPSGSD